MTKPSWIVKPMVLAVGRLARRSTAEVPGGAHGVIAFLAQQFDEPGLVLHFFVENAGRHVVGAWVLAEGQVADLAPGADGAAFRLQKHGEYVRRRWGLRQIRVGAAGAVGERADVLGNAA